MADSTFDPETDLPPPGSRWGTGAQSVLPYLTKTLQARPAPQSAAEPRDREGAATVREPRASAPSA